MILFQGPHGYNETKEKEYYFHRAFAFHFTFDIWFSSQSGLIPFTIYQSHIHLMF